MIQIKDIRREYRIDDQKEKAAFNGRSFQQDSKTYLKSKNPIIWIIEYSRRNCILFFRQTERGGERNG